MYTRCYTRCVADATSAISQALHREGICDARVERVRCTDTCRILGVTTPATALQGLLKYRDVVLKAVRSVDTSISDVFPQQKWKWVRIHNISPVRHKGEKEGGLRKLREELEAENSGVRIPVEVRWLGEAKSEPASRSIGVAPRR